MKIIQIAVSAGSATEGHHDSWEALFALTDDGKIFMMQNPSNSEYQDWKQVKPLKDDQ